MEVDAVGTAALRRQADASEGLGENVAPYFGAATVAADFGLGVLWGRVSQGFGQEGGQKIGGLFFVFRF